MIQRIQTLFLLLALATWNLLFFKPVIGFTNDAGGSWMLFADSVRDNVSGERVLNAVPLLLLVIIIDLLILLGILLYKRRVLQMRVTLYNMVLQVLSYAMIFFYIVLGKRNLDADPHLLFYSIVPVVVLVFSFLAFRGIRRDILLLKALDRLR